MTNASLSEEAIWRRYDDDEHRLTAPVSERMLDLAELQPGQQVLDLATGRGEPALRAARRVAPDGRVLGVDIGEAMLRMARERAEVEGIANLELRVGNAEDMPDIPLSFFDAVLARWGLMYFQKPLAALTRARQALRPEGVLVAAFWAEPERVPYFTLPRRLLARYTTIPAIDMSLPGTFRYAELARVEADFETAGLRIDHVEELDIPVMEAAGDDELIAWVRAFGLARLMTALPDAVQRQWQADLIEACAPLRNDGVVRLGGVTRIVRACPAA